MNTVRFALLSIVAVIALVGTAMPAHAAGRHHHHRHHHHHHHHHA